MTDPDSIADRWAQDIAAAGALRARILREYHQLRAAGTAALTRRLRVEIKCRADSERKTHLLLHVWQGTDDRLYWYTPAYRISPAREAEESTAAGRARFRSPGGKWPELAGVVDPENGDGVKMQCSHSNAGLSYSDLLNLAAGAVSGMPTRRRM